MRRTGKGAGIPPDAVAFQLFGYGTQACAGYFLRHELPSWPYFTGDADGSKNERWATELTETTEIL
jgi:hypothetical protein